MAEGKVRVGEISGGRTSARAADPTVLLVMGANAQAIFWPPASRAAVAAGHHVMRFDNRDVGLSTWVDYAQQPYTIADMAGDAVRLLDALGIERCALGGRFDGGMISQQAALDHPARVRSLTSIMSSPSSPADPGCGHGAEGAARDRRDAVGALVRRRDRDCSALSGRAPFDEAAARGLHAGRRAALQPRLRPRTPRRVLPPRAPRVPARAHAGDPRRRGSDPAAAHGEATSAASPGAKLGAAGGRYDLPAGAIPEYVEAVLAHRWRAAERVAARWQW
jgi:pimeloyl-ACP methyl ester carboxylesterase